MPDRSLQPRLRSRLAIWVALAALGVGLTSDPVSAQDIELPAIEPAASDDSADTSVVFMNAAISGPLSGRFSAFALGAYSTERDVGLGVYDISARLHEHVGIGASYIHTIQSGPDEHTMRGHVDFHHAIGPTSFVLRNAFDYRVQNGSIDARWRYRPRAKAQHKTRLGVVDVLGYAYVEPIYNLTQGEFTRTYFSGGGYVRIYGPVWVNALYLRLENRNSPDINLWSAGVVVLIEP